jgi:hypothetical protein
VARELSPRERAAVETGGTSLSSLVQHRLARGQQEHWGAARGRRPSFFELRTKRTAKESDMTTSSTSKKTAVWASETPAELLDGTVQDAGLGVGEQRGDYLTPQLQTAQVTSPVVDPNDATHVPGAKPGDLIIRDLSKVFAGNTGVTVLHCGQINTFSEFLPGRQGFVERHPDAVRRCIDQAKVPQAAEQAVDIDAAKLSPVEYDQARGAIAGAWKGTDVVKLRECG